MVIAIYSLLIITSLLRPKSKWITYAILIFMWVVGTFSYGNADESLYFSRYESPSLWRSYSEYGFALIIQICRLLNFSFVGFKGCIFFVETVLVGSTVLKYAKHPKLVLLLYIVCPYPLMVVQMRSSLAASIMVFSCRFLLDQTKDYEKINCIKYVIGIVLASFVHTSAIFGMFFLVAKVVSTKKTIIITVLFNILVLFVLTPNIIGRIINLFGAGNRIGQYLTTAYASSEWRHIGPVVYVLYVASFMLLFFYRYRKKYKNSTNMITTELIQDKQVELIIRINIILLILVSIILKYTSEMTRIQEGFMVINYIFVTNCIREGKFGISKISRSNLTKFSVTIFFVGIYAGLILIHYLTDLVWIPFWCNNSLLSF